MQGDTTESSDSEADYAPLSRSRRSSDAQSDMSIDTAPPSPEVLIKEELICTVHLGAADIVHVNPPAPLFPPPYATFALIFENARTAAPFCDIAPGVHAPIVELLGMVSVIYFL